MQFHKILVLVSLFIMACSNQELVSPGHVYKKRAASDTLPLQLLVVRDSELLLSDSHLDVVLDSLQQALAWQTPFSIVSYQQRVMPLSRIEPFELRWSAWKQQLRQPEDFQLVLFIVPQDALENSKEGAVFLGYADATGVLFDRKKGMATVVYTEAHNGLLCRMLHELGHLFGAGHDSTGIMQSGCGSEYYSQQSIREMEEHRDRLKVDMLPFQSRRKEE